MKSNLETTPQFIGRIYLQFVKDQIKKDPEHVVEMTQMLKLYKKDILARAFFLLGVTQGQDLDTATREKFENLFTTEGGLVDSFCYLPSFFEGGDDLVKPSDHMSLDKKDRVTAKNYLKVFLRGTKVGVDNAWFWESPLATPALFQTIMVAGDPGLEKAVREEIQEYFDRAFNYIDTELPDSKASDTQKLQIEKRFQSHLGPLIAMMAFFKYPEGSVVNLPVKVKDKNGEHWKKVAYEIKKFDLSPKPTDGGLDGIIGRLLRDEDRFYIYGFEPPESETNANPILAWSGTPPDGVAGSDVATTYNLIGGKAIAEGHNTADVEEWILKHTNIVSYGHSKGGMGQIFIAKYPDHFKSFEGLCGGLHSATLKRLKTEKCGNDNLTWDDRIKESKKKPEINLPTVTINDQYKDIVFSMDEGFLTASQMRHILTNAEPALNMFLMPRFLAEGFQHHSFSLLGHPLVMVLKGDEAKERLRPLRAFLDTSRNILSYFVGIQKKMSLIVKLLRRELNEFCVKHNSQLALMSLAVYLSIEIALFTTGGIIGFPLILLATGSVFLAADKLFELSEFCADNNTLFASMSFALYTALQIALLITGITTGFPIALLSIGGVFLASDILNVGFTPKILNTVIDIALTGIDLLYTLTTRAITLVLITPSAIKNLSISLYRDPQPLKDLGNYLLSMQIVPDIISGAISVTKGVLKGLFYVLPNVIWWKMTAPSYVKREPSPINKSTSTILKRTTNPNTLPSVQGPGDVGKQAGLTSPPSSPSPPSSTVSSSADHVSAQHTNRNVDSPGASSNSSYEVHKSPTAAARRQ